MKKIFVYTLLFSFFSFIASVKYYAIAELPKMEQTSNDKQKLPTLGSLKQQEDENKTAANDSKKAEQNEIIKATKDDKKVITDSQENKEIGELKKIKTTKEDGIVIDMSKNSVSIKQEEIEMKKTEKVDLNLNKEPEKKVINDGQKDITNEEQEKINEELQNKSKSGKIIKDEDMGKLLTIFNIDRSLNYNYNSITYSNSEFLENASEFKVIRQVLKEQRNPELKKKKEEEEAKKRSLAEAVKKGKIEKQFNGIHLTSLLFFSPQEWTCRIDGQTIKSEDRNKKGSRYSIVKVNKTSIVFVLKKTTKQMIKQVEELIDKKYQYYQNYFTTEENGQTHIGFKLFVGQKIDFDTMMISG